MTDKNVFIWFLAGAIVFSVSLYSLCYRFDNKYTANAPQPENGLLKLDADTLRETPVTFLIDGWEIYRNALLAPEDFTQNTQPDEYVFIGQYGGFEGNDPKGSPHGSATYRLNIALPQEPAGYTLELPEIYSAYKLYINGVPAEQFGNPDRQAYSPQTGNSALSFFAKNRVEIIVAAADYSHMYSGMVYPPAFGVPYAVSAMIQTRLTVRAAFCSIALALALLFLAVGYLTRGSGAAGSMLLFGAICLCFVGYVCYPIVKTIYRGGIAWYGVENFCFCAMLLLVMLLQRSVSGDKSGTYKILIAIGGFVCGCSLLRAASHSGDLRFLAAYSFMIGFYKWAAAFLLTVSMLRSAGKNIRYGFTMLVGIIVYDCALIMDRLLPLFEPVRFGWFPEIGGFAIVLTLGTVMGQEMLRQYRDKLVLEGRIAGAESLVEMQRAYYPVILEGIEEARHARHDLRHHINVIQGLVSSGKYGELETYLRQYASGVSHMPTLTYCENDVADVILRHFAVLASRESICYEVKAGIPETLSVESADLCIIISNLLENALEACAYVTGKKRISVTIKQVRNQLVILVDNSFDGNAVIKGGRFISRKRRNREGAGIASVRAIAAKYGGSAACRPEYENNVFRSEVILSPKT